MTGALEGALLPQAVVLIEHGGEGDGEVVE